MNSHFERCALAVVFLSLVAGCSDDETFAAATLPGVYSLEGDTLFPEGTAYSPGVNAFFVGSLGNGSITRLNADGSQEVVYEAEADWATLGMKISPTTGELVTCAINSVGTPAVRAEIWSFDPATGERLHAVPLDSVMAGATCNDVAMDNDGVVFVTDRENPNLYRVDLATEEATMFLTDPLLAPDVIGCNGIVVTDALLLVGKYSAPTLLRVPLDDPSALAEITLTGDTPAGLPNGFDGIVLHNGAVIIAGNSEVYRLTTDDTWTSATVTASSPGINVTALTIANDRVYGLKGEVVAFVLGGMPDLPFQLKALDL